VFRSSPRGAETVCRAGADALPAYDRGNGTGISIGDASWLNSMGGLAVSGSGTQPAIQGWGHLSGASGIAQAGTTNCPQ
jgi:hypothetical protein